MPTVRIVLEYNGARFHGWQLQPQVRTVQGEVERAIATVLRETPSRVIASGRTDRGVHARAQVAHFSCQCEPNLDALRLGVSSILRGEVSLLRAEIVPDTFDARSLVVSKQYTYWILNRSVPPVLDEGKVWLVTANLNVSQMQAQAQVLQGLHDFSSFRGAECDAQTPVKEILESEVLHVPPYILYRVVGRGFLKHMVRIIVGTLVECGRGAPECQDVAQILAARDRGCAGLTAPPQGLFLDWVQYPDFCSA